MTSIFSDDLIPNNPMNVGPTANGKHPIAGEQWSYDISTISDCDGAHPPRKQWNL
jgi:hypothetical protein